MKKHNTDTASNNNINLLCKFNLSDKNSFEVFNESTRDITNLNVLKCVNSGVIVLEKFMISKDYYEKNINYTKDFKGIIKTEKGSIKSKPIEDDIRRFESYKELIKGSKTLDFGCGKGGFIQLCQKISKRSVGVELNICLLYTSDAADE